MPFLQGVHLDLTKEEALGTLKEHFTGGRSSEVDAGAEIDSAFSRGKYDT